MLPIFTGFPSIPETQVALMSEQKAMRKRDLSNRNVFLVGIDVGGTFTDLSVYNRKTGDVFAVKIPSNRAHPEEAVFGALKKSGVPSSDIELIVHGTTVATNALLERRGSPTGFVTTNQFRDILELGRTTRLVPNSLYDPYFERPKPLVERRHRICVKERMNALGEIEECLDEDELETVALNLKTCGIEAVTIGFINSYRNPENEQKARQIFRRHFDYVTISTEVLNEVREFERFSAAVINGYVMPVMAGYSSLLTETVKKRNEFTGFYTVASHGGLLSTAAVKAYPVRTILSGPAAGIAAAVHFAEAVGQNNLITYDMGGTSTDVTLVYQRKFPLKRETILEGLIIKLPQLDIHTVGAGGGSIAALDTGGGLQVGPESAGSDPGPACYGLSGLRPTITDAQVVLGRLCDGQELGKSLCIDREKAVMAIYKIAHPAGLNVTEMADAVINLAVAKMAAAVREISIMRGFDPAEFTLLSYGGAGPLHAALVAEEVGIQNVIVPTDPGAFSAFGTLCAPLKKDCAETLMSVLDDDVMKTAQQRGQAMRKQLIAEFTEEGADTEGIIFERQFDLRYKGQAHDLTVVVPEEASREETSSIFELAFEREYGRRDTGRSIELVNVRMVASIAMQTPNWIGTLDGVGEPSNRRNAYIDGKTVEVAVWKREDLAAHTSVQGPAIIDEMSSTTYVPPGWVLSMGHYGEILLSHS